MSQKYERKDKNITRVKKRTQNKEVKEFYAILGPSPELQ
jgi:hypothetical protein